LRLHPDLAGRLAQQGCLTSESTAEQQAAGLDTLTEEEKAILRDANAEYDTLKDNFSVYEWNILSFRYKKKFGFPFVICARQNKKDAILIGIQQRLLNISHVELVNGIAEVEKICYLRLQQLVNNPQTNVKM
jgi:2-oxo-4-hydroxy-4-carboxy-5-ureidoimidazoline decarboxylase